MKTRMKKWRAIDTSELFGKATYGQHDKEPSSYSFELAYHLAENAVAMQHQPTIFNSVELP